MKISTQAVGNVGLKSKRGRHTTRSAILLDLPGGGLLVDTPGFNYPSMERVTTSNVARFFPEIQRITDVNPCRFSNCTHVHEPGCSVRDGGWERYEYYVRCAGHTYLPTWRRCQKCVRDTRKMLNSESLVRPSTCCH